VHEAIDDGVTNAIWKKATIDKCRNAGAAFEI